MSLGKNASSLSDNSRALLYVGGGDKEGVSGLSRELKWINVYYKSLKA